MLEQGSKETKVQAWSGFIGIDWSGAKAQFTDGIQLARASLGTAVPKTIPPPQHRYWSRQNVYELMLEQAALTPAGAPLLIGIDFAFAHPFADFGSYFPDCENAPPDAVSLWQLVDEVNWNAPNFYGGEMFRHPVWGTYYLSPPKFDATLYKTRRRLTETAAKAAGCSPSPTFKAVGADNVGTGTMAGMRMLYNLRQKLGDQLAIWPFDNFSQRLDEVRLVLVEIFPSYYFYRVGMSPAKQAAAQASFLTQALSFYNSCGTDQNFVAKGKDADEADAIISAAALRYFAEGKVPRAQSMFCLPQSIRKTARQEGWIFGVDPIYAS